MDEDGAIALGKKRAALIELQEQEDLRAVASTAAGRAVLWSILSACKIYSDGFCGGDRAAMAREAGMRYVGLSLLEKVLTLNSEAYTVMRNEALARRRELDERLKQEQD